MLVFSLIYVFRVGSSHMHKLMLTFTITELVHNLGYLLELMAKTEQEALLAVKVEYLGSSLVAILFMMFIFGARVKVILFNLLFAIYMQNNYYILPSKVKKVNTFLTDLYIFGFFFQSLLLFIFSKSL